MHCPCSHISSRGSPRSPKQPCMFGWGAVSRSFLILSQTLSFHSHFLVLIFLSSHSNMYFLFQNSHFERPDTYSENIIIEVRIPLGTCLQNAGEPLPTPIHVAGLLCKLHATHLLHQPQLRTAFDHLWRWVRFAAPEEGLLEEREQGLGGHCTVTSPWWSEHTIARGVSIQSLRHCSEGGGLPQSHCF